MGKIIVVLSACAVTGHNFIKQCVNNMPVHAGTGGGSFCSYQTFVQDKLSVRENLGLVGSLYALSDTIEFDRLLEIGQLTELTREKGGQLPQVQRRVLAWLMALLPKPRMMVVDDLAKGLSQPAQQSLWQMMRRSLEKMETTVLYVTDDLETVRELGEGVWFLGEDGVMREVVFPAGWKTWASYSFTLFNKVDIELFIREIQEEAKILEIPVFYDVPSDLCVRVLVHDAGVMTDFVRATGQWVADFASEPLLLGNLPAGWEAQLVLGQEVTVPTVTVEAQTSHQRWQAVWQVALTEWRYHFRSFWKAGNLIFSALYQTLFLLMAVQGSQSSPELAPLLLGLALASSALFSTAWLPVVLGRWRLPSQSAYDKASARWLVGAPFVLVPAGRKRLLGGVYLGHFLLTGVHAILFLGLFSWGYSGTPRTVLLAFIGWLLLTGFGLTFGLFVGQRWPWPRQSQIVGPLLYFLLLVSIASLNRLPRASWPLLWWWPPAGLMDAWEGLFPPHELVFSTVAVPLILAIGLTSALAWLVWRRFKQLKPYG